MLERGGTASRFYFELRYQWGHLREHNVRHPQSRPTETIRCPRLTLDQKFENEAVVHRARRQSLGHCQGQW